MKNKQTNPIITRTSHDILLHNVVMYLRIHWGLWFYVHLSLWAKLSLSERWSHIWLCNTLGVYDWVKSLPFHNPAWQLVWGVCGTGHYEKKSLLLVSSPKRTLFQKSCSLFRCSFAKINCAAMFFFFFFLATLPNKPYLFSFFQTVLPWTCKMSAFIEVDTCVGDLLVKCIWLAAPGCYITS